MIDLDFGYDRWILYAKPFKSHLHYFTDVNSCVLATWKLLCQENLDWSEERIEIWKACRLTMFTISIKHLFAESVYHLDTCCDFVCFIRVCLCVSAFYFKNQFLLCMDNLNLNRTRRIFISSFTLIDCRNHILAQQDTELNTKERNSQNVKICGYVHTNEWKLE